MAAWRQVLRHSHGPSTRRRRPPGAPPAKTDAYDLRLAAIAPLFVKERSRRPFDVSTPGVLWATALVRLAQTRDAPYITQTGAQLTFHNPLIRAAIESLHDGYKTSTSSGRICSCGERGGGSAGSPVRRCSRTCASWLIHAYLRPIANPYFRP